MKKQAIAAIVGSQAAVKMYEPQSTSKTKPETHKKINFGWYNACRQLVEHFLAIRDGVFGNI